MQSVTSALSLFQRFLTCQTKPILIGRFALLLRDWMPPRDLKQQGFVSKAVNCQDVSMFSHLLGDML